MKRIKRMCYVPNCGQPSSARALCAYHHQRNAKGLEDLTLYQVIAELDDCLIPISREAYRKNLRSILRGVKVRNKDRRAFNARMMEGYEAAYGKTGGRGKQ
jgi:hypothetical protein